MARGRKTLHRRKQRGGGSPESLSLADKVHLYGLTREDLEGMYSPDTLDEIFEKPVAKGKGKRKSKKAPKSKKSRVGPSDKIAERLMEEGR